MSLLLIETMVSVMPSRQRLLGEKEAVFSECQVLLPESKKSM